MCACINEHKVIKMLSNCSWTIKLKNFRKFGKFSENIFRKFGKHIFRTFGKVDDIPLKREENNFWSWWDSNLRSKATKKLNIFDVAFADKSGLDQ